MPIGDELDCKLEALRQHASQGASAGGLVDAARGMAARAGDGEQPAELFRALRLRARR